MRAHWVKPPLMTALGWMMSTAREAIRARTGGAGGGTVAKAPGEALVLSRGERDARLLLQLEQRRDVVLLHRLLEERNLQLLDRAREARGVERVEAAVRIDM